MDAKTGINLDSFYERNKVLYGNKLEGEKLF